MALDNPSIQDLIRAASAPCLVLREEDIPQVKKKRDGKAWASEAFARLLRESDAWVDRRIEIPDRGGQRPQIVEPVFLHELQNVAATDLVAGDVGH